MFEKIKYTLEGFGPLQKSEIKKYLLKYHYESSESFDASLRHALKDMVTSGIVDCVDGVYKLTGEALT